MIGRIGCAEQDRKDGRAEFYQNFSGRIPQPGILFIIKEGNDALSGSNGLGKGEKEIDRLFANAPTTITQRRANKIKAFFTIVMVKALQTAQADFLVCRQKGCMYQ